MFSPFFEPERRIASDYFDKNIIKINPQHFDRFDCSPKVERSGIIGFLGKAWRWIRHWDTHIGAVRKQFLNIIRVRSAQDIKNEEDFYNVINLVTNVKNFDRKVITKHEDQWWTTLFFWTQVPHFSDETFYPLIGKIKSYLITKTILFNRTWNFQQNIKYFSKCFEILKRISPEIKPHEIGIEQTKLVNYLNEFDKLIDQNTVKLNQKIRENQRDFDYEASKNLLNSYDVYSMFNSIEILFSPENQSSALQEVIVQLRKTLDKAKEPFDLIQREENRVNGWIVKFEVILKKNKKINLTDSFAEIAYSLDLKILLERNYLDSTNQFRLQTLVTKYENMKETFAKAKNLNKLIDEKLKELKDKLFVSNINFDNWQITLDLMEKDLPYSFALLTLLSSFAQVKSEVSLINEAAGIYHKLLQVKSDYITIETRTHLKEARNLLVRLPRDFKIYLTLSRRVDKIVHKDKFEAENLTIKLNELSAQMSHGSEINLEEILQSAQVISKRAIALTNNQSIPPQIRTALKEAYVYFLKVKEACLKIQRFLDQITLNPLDPLKALQDFYQSINSKKNELNELKPIVPTRFKHLLLIIECWKSYLKIQCLKIDENLYDQERMKLILNTLKMNIVDTAQGKVILNILKEFVALKAKYCVISSDPRVKLFIEGVDKLDKQIVAFQAESKQILDSLTTLVQYLISSPSRSLTKVAQIKLLLKSATFPTPEQIRRLCKSICFENDERSQFEHSLSLIDFPNVKKSIALLKELGKFAKFGDSPDQLYNILLWKRNSTGERLPPLTMKKAKELRENFDQLRKSLSYIGIFSILRDELKLLQPLENQLVSSDFSQTELFRAIAAAELYQKVDDLGLQRSEDWTLSDIYELEEIIATVDSKPENFTYLFTQMVNERLIDAKRSMIGVQEEFTTLKKEYDRVYLQIESLIQSLNDISIFFIAKKEREVSDLQTTLEGDISKLIEEPRLGKKLKEKLYILRDLTKFFDESLTFSVEFGTVSEDDADGYFSPTQIGKHLENMTHLVNNPSCPGMLRRQIDLILRSYQLGVHPRKLSLNFEKLDNALYSPTTKSNLFDFYNKKDLIQFLTVDLERQRKNLEQHPDSTYEYTAITPFICKPIPNDYQSPLSNSSRAYTAGLLHYMTSQFIEAKEVQLLVAEFEKAF